MSDSFKQRAQDVEVARLSVKVDDLDADVSELKADVKSLLAIVNQTKGGWKVIVLVAGVAGTMGALIAKVIPFLGGVPR